MRDLTPRTALHTAAVYFKPDGKQAVSASFRYFSQYGSERTDEEGNVLGRLEPHDMAFDIGYSRTVAEGLVRGPYGALRPFGARNGRRCTDVRPSMPDSFTGMQWPLRTA